MRIGEGVISNLVELMYETGITSSKLIAFFNSFGGNYPVEHMLGSKRRFSDQAWRELNGKPEMMEAIRQALHPHFWPNSEIHQAKIDTLRRCLRIDGFDLIQSGDLVEVVPIAKAGAGSTFNELKKHGEKLKYENLLSRIRVVERDCDSSPSDAIGAAKELIEAVAKEVIERLNGSYGNESASALVKLALKQLELVEEGTTEESRGKDAIRGALNSLVNIAHQLDELRGLYGSGHGKSSSSKGLSPRHARLAVGAAGTACLFLLESLEATEKRDGKN